MLLVVIYWSFAHHRVSVVSHRRHLHHLTLQQTGWSDILVPA